MDTKVLKVVLGAGAGALLGMGWGYAVRRMTLDKEARTGFVGAREGALLGAFLGAVSVAFPVYGTQDKPDDDSGREEAWELLRLNEADRSRLAPRASEGARQWLSYWASRDNSYKFATFSLAVTGMIAAGTFIGSRFGKTDEERTQGARRGELWSLVGAAMVGTWALMHRSRAEKTRDDVFQAAYGNGVAALPMKKNNRAKA